MSKIRTQRTLLAVSLLLALVAAFPASAQVSRAVPAQTANPERVRFPYPNPPITPIPPPDSTLYTTYDFENSYQNVVLTVCGYTKETSGCYAADSFGPLGHVGALIEGDESVSGNTVTRNIYVVDDADGGGTGVKLYVYTKTDVISATFDTVTFTLANTVSLPLTGGANATTYMAANNGYLFIGTNQGDGAVKVQKSSLAVEQTGGGVVSSITSDKYGYVNVNFGSGFYTFDPSGNSEGAGAGSEFLLSNSNGLSAAVFAAANPDANNARANLTAQMKIRSENATAQITTGNSIRILPPAPPLFAVLPPDGSLYGSYTFENSYQNVLLTVCGSTQTSDGCYGGDLLGPFGHAGALIEGEESVSGNTVTRNIYVVDDADGGGTGVKLYVYTRTDVVTSSNDAVTVTLANTISLPLTGGANATTYMAASDGYLYIGTSLGSTVAQVQKSGLAVGQVNIQLSNVSSITSDKYGYVTVTSGDTFVAIGPTGNLVGDGGGTEFMLNNSNGLSTAVFAAANADAKISHANLAARMKIRSRNAATPIMKGN
jgi:hypothetical protein